MITTIQLEKKTKDKLDELKQFDRESYNVLIERMIKGQKHIVVDEESLKETIEILSNPEALKDIAEALKEYSEGKFVELK